MFELNEIEELANQVNLSILYEIAKNSAQIGNEILKIRKPERSTKSRLIVMITYLRNLKRKASNLHFHVERVAVQVVQLKLNLVP